MNDNPPPSDASGAPGPAPDRFFAWLRGLGIIRGEERWFAGVAGGIAAKAGIDPLIVRGIFVVLAVLGGPGLLLYLAGWLLLPDSTGRIHAEEVLRGRASAGTITVAIILGVVLVFPVLVWGLGSVFAGPWGWSSWGFVPDWMRVTLGVIWWAVVVPGLIIWAIVWYSQSRGQGSQPNEPGTEGPGSAENAATGAASFSEQANRFADEAGRQAQQWGDSIGQKAETLGQKIEDQTKEWERRGREYHEAHKLGAGQLVVTLALALIAGGATAAIALTYSADQDTVLTAGLIAAVAVLGISTVIAGVRGRDSGWVGFLSFCGVIALLLAPFSTVMPEQTEFVPFGSTSISPNEAGVDQGLVSIAGNSSVIVEDLPAGVTAGSTEVWLGGGNVTVSLTAGQPARVRVDLLGGNVRDLRVSDDTQFQSGILLSRLFESNLAGADESEIVEIRVRLLGGNVKIRDGASTAEDSFTEDEREQIESLKQQLEELESAR